MQEVVVHSTLSKIPAKQPARIECCHGAFPASSAPYINFTYITTLIKRR